MDSAKNKKLFPDFSEDQRPQGPSDGVIAPGFNVSKVFWESIENDPQLRRELERYVDQRAQALIEEASGPERERLFAAAKEQGEQAGWDQAKEQINEVLERLNRACEAVISEKGSLLKEHESLWCRALAHIVRRLFLPLTPQRLQGIETWLQESIREFSKNSQVGIHVSQSLYEKVMTTLPPPSDGSWTWVMDSRQSDGQLRVSFVGGGALFDSHAEQAELEQILNFVMGTQT